MVMALAMVSRSRISPISTTSGSSRKALAQRGAKAIGVVVDFALDDDRFLAICGCTRSGLRW